MRMKKTNLKVDMNVNQITKMTAAKDLKDLVAKGFLEMGRKGRNVSYYGTKKIKELFNS